MQTQGAKMEEHGDGGKRGEIYVCIPAQVFVGGWVSWGLGGVLGVKGSENRIGNKDYHLWY